jgi:hypothetical protein
MHQNLFLTIPDIKDIFFMNICMVAWNASELPATLLVRQWCWQQHCREKAGMPTTEHQRHQRHQQHQDHRCLQQQAHVKI